MRTRHDSKHGFRIRRHRLVLALVGALGTPAAMAQSACSGSTACLPVDGTVVSGTITSSRSEPGGKINPYYDQSSTTLTITQTSKGGIIDWGSFNIGPDNTLNFLQPAGGVTLNRVVGFGYGDGGCYTSGGCAPTPSFISGGLSATGSVFIVNRAGITFNGTGSQVNVGGLIASTVDILDSDFLAGVDSNRFIFRGQSGDGEVANQGAITIHGGGRAAFIGTTLSNDGTITANGGSVAFGAASSVTLDFQGDGLTQVTLNGLSAPDVIATLRNHGEITADGGQILMRAMANAAGEGGIVNGGTLRARSMASRAGRIELTAPGGTIELGDTRDGYLGPGVIDASGGAGLAGGDVVLAADVVWLRSDPTPVGGSPRSGSIIDVSGNGGGNVRIDAGRAMVMDANAGILALGGSGGGGHVEVQADAIALQGTAVDGSWIDASGAQGGRVRLQGNQGVGLAENTRISADGSTGGGGSLAILGGQGLAAYGRLSARGIAAGGNILTMSGGDFDLRGLVVDAGSAGTAGTWTLWAPRLSVVHGAQAGSMASVALGNQVQDAEINRALNNGSNVSLRAGVVPGDSGDVFFNEGVDIAYTLGKTPLAFRVDADADIDGQGFSIRATGAALSMAFNADASNRNNGFAGIRFDRATLDTNGGDLLMYGQSDLAAGVASRYDSGINLTDTRIATGGGRVLMRGSSTGQDAGDDDAGVRLVGTTVATGAGGVEIVGTGAMETHGVLMRDGGIATTLGAVGIRGESANRDGVGFFDAAITTAGGGISVVGVGGGGGVHGGVALESAGGSIMVEGEGGTGNGIEVSGPVSSDGGEVRFTGRSANAIGLLFGGAAPGGITSAGGNIALSGDGATGGVLLRSSGAGVVNAGAGMITVNGNGSATDAVGVHLDGVRLVGSTGDIQVTGSAPLGIGVLLAAGAGISTTTGGIALTGIGDDVGLRLDGGEISTQSGHLDLRGRGMGAAADGLVIGDGVVIATNGGGIELAGQGEGGAGIALGTGARVDAGNSVLVVRAANDGSSDALRLGGQLISGTGVNLRPGGVDANGALTERVNDEILLGVGNGFALDSAELARITAPELVIGSNLHAGAIRVLQAVQRDGNLSLQNQGGSGGIDLQAALDVGDGTLALASGGSITQASGGAITAHSLLATAGGDVLLAAAQNNVADTTLAGAAGGRFEFLDVDTLAIGHVAARGFDASGNMLSTLQATGIAAAGDVVVRNLAGDMTLRAGVQGADIDLVTAGRLQNPGGASLVASVDWRVWANTWEGETRGGLAGSGALPNLYGCVYLGACGVTVPSVDNHFIYVQQPTAVIAFNNATREYGLPNPLLTFSVTGAILGDTAASVATGTASTTATIGSDVGNYPITGSFTSASGYRLQFVPGTLAITPATLLFTADGFVRYLGTPNPLFTGTVTGFRNGDTVDSVFGSGTVWSSPAGLLSPIGFYPVVGGTSAKNYVFTQAPGNATALQIVPLPQLASTPIDFVRETIDTYVYDRNFGSAPMCAVNTSLDDQQLASYGDGLSNEWSKVRSRPNLTNCFDSERKNSCGDF